jgi:hypothetical protein
MEAARKLFRDRTNDMHEYVEGLKKTFQGMRPALPNLFPPR